MDSVHSSVACLPACLIVIRIDYFQKFQKFHGTPENLLQHTSAPRHTVWEPLL